jgi:DNA-binding protein H-NS
MTNNETIKTYMELEQERVALKSELNKLEQRAKEAKARERSEALSKVQALINSIDLIRGELSFGTKKKATSEEMQTKAKRPAKYYDPQTGKTWSGSGKKPLWMRVENGDNFLIAKMPVEMQSHILRTSAPANVPATGKPSLQTIIGNQND